MPTNVFRLLVTGLLFMIAGSGRSLLVDFRLNLIGNVLIAFGLLAWISERRSKIEA